MKRIIIITISIFMLLSVAAGVFYIGVTKANGNEPSKEINNKLVSIFGDDAKELKVLKKYQENGKEVLLLSSASQAKFKVDSEGNLLHYINNSKKSINKPISLEESQTIAYKNIKKFRAGINFESYKLVKSVMLDDKIQNKYFYTWQKFNSNGVAIGTITINTNLSGDIIGFSYNEKDIPEINNELIKISEEQAKQIAIMELKKNNTDIYVRNISARKINLENQLMWLVDIAYSYPTSNPEIHAAASKGVFIDVSTGKILSPNLKPNI